MNDFNWKKPLSLDEQIDYLKNEKKVVFNIIKEDEAKEILGKFNYINIISAFKINFIEKDYKKKPIKNKDKHVYNSETEFANYYNLYCKERECYKKIYNNISNFETIFNSTLSYHITINYKLDSRKNFSKFIDTLLLNTNKLQLKRDRVLNIRNTILKLEKSINSYTNIFVLFDRLSLGDLLSIYISSSKNCKQKIFNELSSFSLVFNTEKIGDFEKAVFIVNSVRNRVYHNNSLEILINYYNIRKKIFRDEKGKSEIRKIINELSK